MDKVFYVLNGMLLMACLLIATMVVSTACRTRAAAQVAGEVGSIVAVTGPPRPTDDQPLFMADTKHHKLLVYEYQPQIDQFSLKAVRHIEYDPRLSYFNRARKNPHPTPDDIQRMVRRMIR
ncbi:MAG: hypothetical protein GXP25_18520 [Planctomycetes bacterium]|nr:hypothetical protein [Planctomycetota bacterium]